MNKSNSCAIVTGAAGGIGMEISRVLAEKNIKLALIGKSSRITSFASMLEEKCVAMPFMLDVADSRAVEKALCKIENQLGVPLILINCAGYGGPFHRVDEVSDEEWERVFNTNVKSILNFCRILLPKMKKSGFGRIINIASIQGLLGAILSSSYVASKHAMIGYTKAIAAEWGAYGITCNAICPGYVDTSMGVQEDKIPNHLKRVIEKTPVGRLATPVEIASLVAYLVESSSGFINGTSVVVDGGLTCHIGVS